MDIGIDLGTVISVTAIKGDVTLVGGVIGEQVRSGVTVIPSALAENGTPSAVWIDPDDIGKVVVGREALQYPDPILFSKRAIGTDLLLECGPHKVTARWVATQILKYLKAHVEQSLGQVVERAVITHPAYFTPNQIEETRQAAIDAGFDMSLPEQMLMEPAAAALAFLHGDPREALTVLTYDLGGGTFDVTVLARSHGATTLKSFDGNRLLGGFNFDKRLAEWIVRKIEAKGRTVAHDPAKTEDRARYARLLLLAESVKITLAQQFTDKVPVQVQAQNILVDAAGRPIMFAEKITRAEFKQLIAAELEETVQRCRDALARASLTIDGVDLLLLVGGSTHGPWVQDALAAAFPGVQIERQDPDLDVGVGAALCAATLPPRSVGAHGVRVVLEVPKTTPLETINVRGTVLAEDGSPLDDALRARLRVLLQTPDGAIRAPVVPDANGVFQFAEVDLEFDTENELKVSITDDQGRERWKAGFKVLQTDLPPGPGGDVELWPTLPRELSIRTRTGPVVIAEEGAPLPARIEKKKFMRLHADAWLAIPVDMEDLEVGTVRISDLPPDGGEAGYVLLTMEITTRGVIRGEATVHDNRGAQIGQGKVRIAFPPQVIPPLAQMKLRFRELEGIRDDDARNSPDSVRRVRLEGAGRIASEQLAHLFAELQPDKLEIYAKLRDFERMVVRRDDDMSPSLVSFNARIEAGRHRIGQMGGDPSAMAHRAELDGIAERGTQFHAQRNKKMWAQENRTLDLLLARLESRVDPVPPRKQWTPELKRSFRNTVDGHRILLASERSTYSKHPDYKDVFRARYDKLEEELDAMLTKIAAVDDELDPDQAMAQLLLATREERDVDKRIKDVPWTVDAPGQPR